MQLNSSDSSSVDLPWWIRLIGNKRQLVARKPEKRESTAVLRKEMLKSLDFKFWF